MANRYWVGTGNWDTTNTANWSASSGGASGASVPASADAVFLTLVVQGVLVQLLRLYLVLA